MALKGQKKTDYMRCYMRKRRLLDPPVRPTPERIIGFSTPGPKRLDKDGKYSDLDADGQQVPDYW